MKRVFFKKFYRSALELSTIVIWLVLSLFSIYWIETREEVFSTPNFANCVLVGIATFSYYLNRWWGLRTTFFMLLIGLFTGAFTSTFYFFPHLGLGFCWHYIPLILLILKAIGETESHLVETTVNE